MEIFTISRGSVRPVVFGTKATFREARREWGLLELSTIFSSEHLVVVGYQGSC